VMTAGKKSTAEQIVTVAMDGSGERPASPPVEVLEQDVKTVTPRARGQERRVGGAKL